jgi:hypothetical protein
MIRRKLFLLVVAMPRDSGKGSSVDEEALAF